MPVFSIIVPVYNSGNCLKECLDSVLSQSFSDYELILVDDGSTDNSGTICDEYTKKDSRIKVIHQKNKGVSSARNTGLSRSCGQYITFLDSDDYLSTNYLRIASDIESDLFADGYDVNGKIEHETKSDKLLINYDEDIVKALNGFYLLTVWAKVYKASIIRRESLMFDEELDFGEDTLFNNNYIKYIDSIQSTSYIGYHHNIKNNISLSQDKLAKPLSNRIKYLEKLLDLWSTNPKIQLFWVNRFLWNVEIEISKIANSKLSKTEKKQRLKKLIRLNIVDLCLKLSPHYFSFINKTLIKYRCYSYILHRYHQSTYN